MLTSPTSTMMTGLVVPPLFKSLDSPLVIMASIVDEPSSSTVAVTLTDEDIPGAKLHEPFETHTIPALQWWLLCRGIN